MKWTKVVLILLIMCCFPIGISAQISVLNGDANLLAGTLTGTSSCIIPTNTVVKGYNDTSINKSFGIFNKNTGSSFPFDSGVILSTRPSKITEDNTIPIGPTVKLSDSDLNKALGINYDTYNLTFLEFEFEAKTKILSFNYLLASDEYKNNLTYNPCDKPNYADGVAILIKEVDSPTSNYENLAVIENDKKEKITVSSFNIRPDFFMSGVKKCDGKNSNYFDSAFNSNTIHFAGQTKTLVARKTDLIPGKKYKIKFVIAEGDSPAEFSALFIEAGSFTSAIDLGKDRLISDKTAICSGETFEINTNLSIAGFNFKWYKDTDTSPIPGEIYPSLQIPQAGTYKVEAIGTSCTLTGKIKVEYGAGMNLNDVELIRCDNGSGSTLFDLTSANSIITNNNPDTTIPKFYADSNQTIEIPDPKAFEKTNSGDQVVYAKGINSKLNCSETAKIKLITKSSSPNLSNIPKPILNDFAGGNNSIELISPSTTSTFEFSIDGINYQEQPLFLRIPKGVYIAYIRNKTSCEYFTYPFTILDYPNFFTPNSYSTNNEWKIKDLDEYTSAVVYIFDRYGKLLKQMDAISESWDGSFNGSPLPADDYWFKLILNDNQVINGHFSLIR